MRWIDAPVGGRTKCLTLAYARGCFRIQTHDQQVMVFNFLSEWNFWQILLGTWVELHLLLFVLFLKIKKISKQCLIKRDGGSTFFCFVVELECEYFSFLWFVFVIKICFLNIIFKDRKIFWVYYSNLLRSHDFTTLPNLLSFSTVLFSEVIYMLIDCFNLIFLLVVELWHMILSHAWKDHGEWEQNGQTNTLLLMKR